MKALKTNSSFSARCRIPSVHSVPWLGAAAFAGAAGDCPPTAQQSPEHCAVSPPQARIALDVSAVSLAQPRRGRGPRGSQPSPAAAQTRTCRRQWPRSCVPEAALLTSTRRAGPGRAAPVPVDQLPPRAMAPHGSGCTLSHWHLGQSDGSGDFACPRRRRRAVAAWDRPAHRDPDRRRACQCPKTTRTLTGPAQVSGPESAWPLKRRSS